MGAFVRRYSAFPSIAELTKIESVVVIDEPPPAQVQGVGSGTVLEVGEFEDGPFNTPLEVFGGSDLQAHFGGFGFTYSDLVPSQNPCARSRKPDGKLAPEFWCGNSFVHLASARFSRLFVCRADTSVGSVEFSRLASLSGNTNPTWDLEPAQVVVAAKDGGLNATATFTAAAAVIVSGAGTYPWAPAGGETIVFKRDGVTYTATFLASDTTHALTIARLNAAAGYTAFTDAGPALDDTTFTGVQRGTGGSVQIVSGSASALTATGFVAGAPVAGTGNVANVAAVTDAEADSIVFAATGLHVDRDAQGKVRIYSPTALTGSVEVDATTTATAFGWATELLATAASGVAGTIPAGTVVKASSKEYVTMQAVDVTADSAGPYSVKVRHALDDGTGTGSLAGAIDGLGEPVAIGAFSVDNPLPLSDALTEAQVDAAYVSAIDTTRAISNPVRQVNFIMAARQSNAVRAALKQNAIDASDNGCFGRDAIVRPPLGTLRATARGNAQPGVGAYRTDREFYCFPQVQKFIAEIARRGTAGGAGFTADGVVDHGWDTAVAALCSALPPEENVGQETTGIVDWVLDVESGGDARNMSLDDYVALKAAGICAPRIDSTVTLQSFVTAVDPALTPELAPGNRRRMADFVEDSLAEFCRPFVKKLSTADRRAQLVSAINSFFSLLKGDPPNIPQRIDGASVDGKSGNTPDLLARNVFVVLVKVRMTPTLDVVVLRVQVGNDVQITTT